MEDVIVIVVFFSCILVVNSFTFFFFFEISENSIIYKRQVDLKRKKNFTEWKRYRHLLK